MSGAVDAELLEVLAELGPEERRTLLDVAGRLLRARRRQDDPWQLAPDDDAHRVRPLPR